MLLFGLNTTAFVNTLTFYTPKKEDKNKNDLKILHTFAPIKTWHQLSKDEYQQKLFTVLTEVKLGLNHSLVSSKSKRCCYSHILWNEYQRASLGSERRKEKLYEN